MDGMYVYNIDMALPFFGQLPDCTPAAPFRSEIGQGQLFRISTCHILVCKGSMGST